MNKTSEVQSHFSKKFTYYQKSGSMYKYSLQKSKHIVFAIQFDKIYYVRQPTSPAERYAWNFSILIQIFPEIWSKSRKTTKRSIKGRWLFRPRLTDPVLTHFESDLGERKFKISGKSGEFYIFGLSSTEMKKSK